MSDIYTMENNSSLTDKQTAIRKTILIVDDSEIMCFLAKSILEKDFEIVIRYDGQDALDYLKQGNRPDLILLDMLMPKMNGRTFVRQVNADPRIVKVPIIFITTVDSTMLINSFKAMGVVDYITKPFVNNDLLSRVKEVLHS